MSMVQKYISQFPKLYQSRTRVLVWVIIFTTVAVVGFQNIYVNPGNGPSHLLSVPGERTLPGRSSSGGEDVGEVPLSRDSEKSIHPSHAMENGVVPVAGESHNETNEIDEEWDDFDIDGDGEHDHEFSVDLGNGIILRKVKDPYGGYITVEKSAKEEKDSSMDMDGESGGGFISTQGSDSKTSFSPEFGKVKELDNSSLAPSPLPYLASSYVDKDTHVRKYKDSGDFVVKVSNNSLSGDRRKEVIVRSGETAASESRESTINCKPKDRAAKKRIKQTVTSVSDMNHLLSKNHGSSCSMVPRWPSARDLQILEARKQIMNAPVVKSDRELYPPVFRNISMFKRSYDLMENMLKVYIYKEGDKPVFHQPELTGIYSSEGWFMKHMEGSTRFIAQDPRDAHLFYMPFGSHLLQFHLYVPGSHSHANLIHYLKTYVATISANYPFWNRTGGADHFVVACHDWATHETGEAMRTSIRALCNADVTEDFELGKDVSLPETNVRSGKDPLRDLGGRPAKKRPILAFFAGQMHGYLRPNLLQHWENRDPAMKIFGPIPHTRKNKMAYVQYMKSSKYCICPRGYEVNSPRVVEAIFYLCVPVIISDNFVPPFFEVLNWEAFSVVVAEKDVPRLKEILEGIPRKKYLKLQIGVRKVQQHFLWHSRPVRYDMFHMILHSIWFNRVFQLRVS